MLDFFFKFFHIDSDDPKLDTGKLAEIQNRWKKDVVSGKADNPDIEQGIDIISEEMEKHGQKVGNRWRSTTKGRGDKQ